MNIQIQVAYSGSSFVASTPNGDYSAAAATFGAAIIALYNAMHATGLTNFALVLGGVQP